MSPLVACGTCVYYALWQRFPPIASWAVLIPLWFVAMATLRSYFGISIAAIPHLIVAVPLVVAVWLFAPGTLGPLLGVWIPMCIVIGTISATRPSRPPVIRRAFTILTVISGLILAAFGVANTVEYWQMSAEERKQFVPLWERPQPRETMP